MSAVNEIDGIEMVDTRVKTNLVHDGNTGGLGLGVQLHHGRRNIRCGDNMLLSLDGGLDDIGVVDVGDQRNGDIVLGDGGLEGFGVVYIEADGLGVGIAASELLCRLESSASDGNVNAGLGEFFDARCGNEARAEKKGGLRHCRGDGQVIVLDGSTETELSLVQYGGAVDGMRIRKNPIDCLKSSAPCLACCPALMLSIAPRCQAKSNQISPSASFLPTSAGYLGIHVLIHLVSMENPLNNMTIKGIRAMRGMLELTRILPSVI